jgi:hypothetical protein
MALPEWRPLSDVLIVGAIIALLIVAWAIWY